MAIRPLNQYWHPVRQDNFLTATRAGRAAAAAAGYRFVRTEGWIYDQPSSPAFFTSPLDQYWNPARGDNFSTATPEGRRDAQAAGYVFVRTEGWVSSNAVVTLPPRPLELYWNPARGDNFTTGTDEGRRDAAAAGYVRVRKEGSAPYPPSLDDGRKLKLFWHAERQDYLTAATVQATLAAARDGYEVVAFEGDSPEGVDLVPLDLYWHPARQDFFSTATAQGRADAAAAGYTLVGSAGRAWPTPRFIPPEWNPAPLKQFFHPGRGDNLLTRTPEVEAQALASGYVFIRVEGWTAVITPLPPP